MKSRADAIERELTNRKWSGLDRQLGAILLAEWAAAVVLASVIFPSVAHVELAVGVGGAIVAAPVSLARVRPGWLGTRLAIAVAQLAWSAMFATLADGHGELQFHVFGSLAILSFYRDWRVIAAATTMVAIEHLALGLWWPAETMFVVALVVAGCLRSRRELRAVAHYSAELADSASRYRALVESTEAVPFEYDPAQRTMSYIAPQAARILGLMNSDELFGAAVHPDERARVEAALAGGIRELEFRVVRDDGRVASLRTVMSTHSGQIHGVAIDMTARLAVEAELRQAQKLESIGRLTAGIAHEINTPIQYVNDSVRFVQLSVVDVMDVVAKHQRASKLAADGEAAEAAEAAREALAADEALDLPFVAASLPEALDRAVEGVDRIAHIVRSMKVFTDTASAEMAPADLNTAIEATLVVARGEYKYVAELEVALEPLPAVTCRVGEISQVVLALVVNAAHAIGETAQRGTIRVETKHTGDRVEIRVSDTGAGIPEAVRDRVFEPFFTTKDVGTAGQSLARARATVVDGHAGKLTFETGVGTGTTFVVALPVQEAMAA
ncbi:MAG TPA: ATP-binding protein [Kofleriaceae bacterium]|jgi:signal transduction histidine kinase|nr:ATP-binding protein [Kofleriaceae bacterium]